MRDLPAISYRTETGELITNQPLVTFSRRACSGELSPVRLPVSYKGQRHLPGYLWMSGTQSLVAYESRLEMMVLLQLDFNPEVQHVVPQPFRLHYRFNARPYRHTPDFLVYYQNQEIEVVNVKPKQFLDSGYNRRAFNACQLAAAEMGWTYSTRSEPDPVFLANLRWLSGFRRKSPYFDRYADALVNAAVCPSSIKAIARSIDGPPCLIRPVLFFLIWKRLLYVDLYHRLTDSTEVSLPQRIQ